jgi:peptidyl-prolyl cis-trans isomerase C
MRRTYEKKTFLALALLAGSLIFALGAAEGEQSEDPAAAEARRALPVAKVDGKTIPLGMFEDAASKQSPMLRKDLENQDKRIDFLNKIIDLEVLAREAARRGYANHGEVESVRKNQLASLMHRRIADQIKDTPPDDEALQKYYEEHSDSYHKPEKVRARHILVSSREKAEKLIADLKAKKVSQHEFRRLAQENSEDESTRLRGGDLTFFTRPEHRKEGDPEIDPKIVEAAFSLKKNGDVYPELIETAKGLHVLMRTGHREAMDLSFEEARERLAVLVRREMRKQGIEDAIEGLKQRFEVEVMEENLKHVVIDLSMGPPEPDAKGGLTRKERQKRSKMMVTDKPRPQPKPLKRTVRKKAEK